MKIRNAPTYALVKEQSNMQIRSAPIYILAGEPPLLPEMEATAALEEMIFELTEFPFETGELVFGPPLVSNQFERNTRVLVSTTNPDVEGEMYFHYNRVPVLRMNIVGEFYLQDETSMSQLFPRLQVYARVPLKETDFLQTNVVDGTLEVVASDSSHFFIPGTKLIIYPAP